MSIETTGRPNGESLKRAAGNVAEHVSGIRHDVAELAVAAGDEVKARAGHLAEDARIKGQDLLDQARKQVLEHPVTALGAAAGAGILLGMIMAGRR